MVAALTGIALLIFGLMCAMSLLRPHWAMVLIFTFLAYEQLITSFVTALARRSWIINVTAAGFAGIAVATSFLAGRQPFRGMKNINTALIFGLYLFCFFGATYSMMPEAARYFLKTGTPYIILMLVILPLLVCTTEQITKMCVPLLFVGCALICLILISPRTTIFGFRLFIDLSYTVGSSDSRGNPLALGELGGMMVIFASLMEQNSKNLLISALRAGSIVLGIAIAFLVAARGQLFFCAFFAVVCYPLAHEIKNAKQFFLRAFSLGALGMILLLVAKFFLAGSEATQRFSAEDLGEGFAGRVFFATSMLDAYGSNPANYLQGLGVGSFNAIVPHDGDGFIYPHNLVIEVLTHHGLIGFTLLSLIFLITAYHALQLLRAGLAGAVDRSAVAILLAMAGYTTMIAMKQGSFLIIPLPFYVFMIISKVYMRSVLDAQAYGYEDQYDDEYEEYADEYGDEDWEEYGQAEPA